MQPLDVTEPVAALAEKPGYALFREMRERSAMTLRAAAPRLGIDYTYLSKVENGHERPSDALVRKMGRLYGFDAESWLVGRAAAEVPEPVRRVIVTAGLDVNLVQYALIATDTPMGPDWKGYREQAERFIAAYREGRPMTRPEFGRACRYCSDRTCAACRAAIVATPHQDGDTYDHDRDHARLSVQHAAVWRLVRDGSWWTLEDLTRAAGYPPASVPAISARLRDFRKRDFGGHTIERQHVKDGLWRYRLVVEQRRAA